MSGKIKRAVIRNIAAQKRCSIAVAAHVYACKSIARKQELCEREQDRQSRSNIPDPSTRPDPAETIRGSAR